MTTGRSDPLIGLDRVSASLDGRRVLHDLSWSLRAGEVWAVLGPNGSGKTTFFRLISGWLWPDPESRGRRRYAPGKPPTGSPVPARERVAIVTPELQDRYRHLERQLSGLEVVLTGLFGTELLYEPVDAARRATVLAGARALGVGHLMDRGVDAMSEGELRRVLLARALVNDPAVLILDEVFEGVDEISLASLRAAVDALARDGTAVVYSTHRPDALLSSTTHQLQLDGGRIVAQGRLASRERSMAPAGAASPHPPPVPSRELPAILVRFRAASVHLGDRQALANLDWTMARLDNWVVLGRNGAGKSTFARLVAGEVHAAYGARVERLGLPESTPIWELRRRIGLVSPESQVRHRVDATGAAVLESGLTGIVAGPGDRPQPTRSQQARLARLVHELDLAVLLDRSALDLSQGELKRILIARALACEPDLLVLDEPFDYLDGASRARFIAVLDKLGATGARFVLAAHRQEDIPASATHALVLDDGRVVRHGPVREVLGEHFRSPHGVVP